MDPEYSVIGRVAARRIWGRGDEEQIRPPTSAARSSSTMCRRPAGPCTRKRWRFNDIRTTLAGRCAPFYDKLQQPATPTLTTRRSPRPNRGERCAAPWRFQLIINREMGPWPRNENPNQGKLHHRRADRSGRGKRWLKGVRRQSADRGGVPRRHGDRLSAAARSKKKFAVLRKGRSTTARIPSSASNTFRNPNGRGRPGRRSNWRGLPPMPRSNRSSSVSRSSMSANAELAPKLLEAASARGESQTTILSRCLMGGGAAACSLGEITHTLYDCRRGATRRNM